MDWFLYVNGLRHERVKDFDIKKCVGTSTDNKYINDNCDESRNNSELPLFFRCYRRCLCYLSVFLLHFNATGHGIEQRNSCKFIITDVGLVYFDSWFSAISLQG